MKARRAATRKRRSGVKTGRPLTEISPRQWKALEDMASYGLTHDDMADFLGITKRTFYAPHIRPQFERVTKMALAKRRYELRKARIDQAIGKPGSVTGIWVDKNVLGWTDRQAITGGSGGPLEFASPAIDHLNEVLDRLARRRSE